MAGARLPTMLAEGMNHSLPFNTFPFLLEIVSVIGSLTKHLKVGGTTLIIL